MSRLGALGALAGLAQGLSSAAQFAMMQRIQDNKDKAMGARREAERSADRADANARQDKGIAANKALQADKIASNERVATTKTINSSSQGSDKEQAKMQADLRKMNIAIGKNAAEGTENKNLIDEHDKLKDTYNKRYGRKSKSTASWAQFYTAGDSPNKKAGQVPKEAPAVAATDPLSLLPQANSDSLDPPPAPTTGYPSGGQPLGQFLKNSLVP